jgi:hypothetical protein
MALPQVAVGGDGLQMWTVAANILNKKSRTADRGWNRKIDTRFRIWNIRSLYSKASLRTVVRELG